MDADAQNTASPGWEVKVKESTFRRLFLGIQAAVPVVLVLIVVALVLLRIDSSEQVTASARDGRIQSARVACNTVHKSDIKLHDFLVREFGSTRFLEDLLASDEQTFADCLVDASKIR